MAMIYKTAKEERVYEILNAQVSRMGYDIIYLRLQGGTRKTLAIYIERQDGKEVEVEDCQIVSKQVSVMLDVEDPIDQAYNLEISSPGINRPLTRIADFVKYANNNVILKTYAPVNDRKRHKGVLLGVGSDEQSIVLQTEEKTGPQKFEISLQNIQDMRLDLV